MATSLSLENDSSLAQGYMTPLPNNLAGIKATWTAILN